MYVHPVFKDLADGLIKNPDRREAHEKARPAIDQLCQDRDILHEALKGLLADGTFLETACNLTIPYVMSGDVMITSNLFVPLRDGARFITQDNIHHHGWRLLTTGIISGNGYDTINFVRNSHTDRTGDKVNLKIEEEFHHRAGVLRSMDSDQPHVVFHPQTSSTTLAVWSADRILTNQGIKRYLVSFPGLSKRISKTIHLLHLQDVLGLNPLKGLYYHPEAGQIVETQNYCKPFDGDRKEVLRCFFVFFQQIGFTDSDFWQGQMKKPNFPAEAVGMVDMLLSGQAVPDIGIWGNMRRRFTRTQIMQAMDHSVAGDCA
jgi:hypothetical protein